VKAVSAYQLSKQYGSHTALREISFSLDAGELFGFIGPDGAGKTSLFRILTTLLLPDGGQAEVLGLDIVKDYRLLRRRIGYMPGRFSLYQDLSVEENLHFYARVFGADVAENMPLIEDVYTQIAPFRKRRAGKLSGGMKQKLALSCALIHRPDILFLDEPTTGVDAVSRREFWDMLGRLKDDGLSIVVSTPYMDEAARCDRVALMQAGEILAIDSPERIIRQFPHELYRIKGPDMFQLYQALQKFQGGFSAYRAGEYIHLAIDFNATSLSHILAVLRESGVAYEQPIGIDPGIEDAFLEKMKEKEIPFAR
jgi:ABC-type multidrug transport system ATPase subunit